MKVFFDRDAPLSHVPDAVDLFGEAGDLSYPSGHVVNTFFWYRVLALLLDAWLWHWLTDVTAGLMLGLLLDRALARLPDRIRWPAAPSPR